MNACSKDRVMKLKIQASGMKCVLYQLYAWDSLWWKPEEVYFTHPIVPWEYSKEILQTCMDIAKPDPGRAVEDIRECKIAAAFCLKACRRTWCKMCTSPCKCVQYLRTSRGSVGGVEMTVCTHIIHPILCHWCTGANLTTGHSLFFLFLLLFLCTKVLAHCHLYSYLA